MALAAFVDWRPADRGASARLDAVLSAQAPLQAGAARVPLQPPAGAVVAGYPPTRAESTGVAAPLYARAVVMGSGEVSVGLVSLEILEVPAPLASRIREEGRRLGLSEVIITATHAHSSFGGYDAGVLAQIIAIGRYDRRVDEGLVAASVDALRQARATLRPAVLAIGATTIDGVSKNRKGPGAPVDPRLVALRFDGEDGSAIARLVAFGSHPTMINRRETLLDGDYPNRAMRALEEDGGVVLFVQGAVGDVSSRPPARDVPGVEVMARCVAEGARRAIAGAQPAEGALGIAAVEVSLPPAQVDAAVPAILRRPAANVANAMVPRRARMDVLRIGSAALAFTPGEATVAVAADLRHRLAGIPGVELSAVVSLAQGYIGYLETEQRCREGSGEAIRTYYGPLLSGRVGEGISAAATALVAAGQQTHR